MSESKRPRLSTALRHCVLGRFTDEATEEQKREMFDRLRAMPEKIPEISALVVGADMGLAAGNHDFALNVEFAKEEDYNIYAAHPAHQEVIQQCIKPILLPGSRVACQFPLHKL